jgi:hypothetical protein
MRPTGTLSTTRTPTPTVVPTPSSTPQLPASTVDLTYDAENRILTLAPGDEQQKRARLCTPLHPYFSTEAVYIIDYQVSLLGLRLPAKARIQHAYPERFGDEVKVHTLDVRRHPIEGFKITGEAANMIGCDLTLNQTVRQTLGFPLDLGEFDDPPRFDHGRVTIEFIDLPAEAP